MDTPRKIQVHGFTDVGCVRTGNEDGFIIQPMGQAKEDLNPSGLFEIESDQDFLAAVSDGMGGAAAGEVASRTGLVTLCDFLFDNRTSLQESEPDQTVQILETAFQKANDAILQKAENLKTHKGMGATMTAIYIKGDVMYLLQIGDSRAYVLREGRFVRITRDQSFVGHLVEMGTITEEQALKHPQRNVILQAMGTQEKLKVDVSFLPLCKDDLVLVCSDGLYSEFQPEQLTERVLAVAERDIRQFVGALIEEAKKAGGKDNITIIGARVTQGVPVKEPGDEPRYRAFPYLDEDNPHDRAQSIFQ